MIFIWQKDIFIISNSPAIIAIKSKLKRVARVIFYRFFFHLRIILPHYALGIKLFFRTLELQSPLQLLMENCSSLAGPTLQLAHLCISIPAPTLPSACGNSSIRCPCVEKTEQDWTQTLKTKPIVEKSSFVEGLLCCVWPAPGHFGDILSFIQPWFTRLLSGTVILFLKNQRPTQLWS